MEACYEQVSYSGSRYLVRYFILFLEFRAVDLALAKNILQLVFGGGTVGGGCGVFSVCLV